MMYNGEQFIEVMKGKSAIRPQGKDRLGILTIDDDGTITYKSRTCRPDIKTVVEQIFKEEAKC
jgi:hypothetical protein